MTSTSTSCANRRRGSSRITRGACSILQIDEAASGDNADPYQVTARLERLDPAHEGQIETIKARYVVGCDGARSTVRKSIGRALHGDSANHAWGVMDVLAVTDFPDVRFKSLIQSANDGSIIIIPREGGYLFRLYIELDKLDARRAGLGSQHHGRRSGREGAADPQAPHARREGDRLVVGLRDRPAPLRQVRRRARRGVAKRLPRVFIAGDACHTHSPKAGQGMNVSMQDGFNLGWKLASVLRKRCAPHLLHTYSAERQAVAKELIDFDREWAALLASSKGFDRGRDPEIFRPARALHRRNGDPLPSLDPHRRTDPSASRRGADDRHALSFRAGHPPGGREAGSSRSRGQGGRPLAHLRVCGRGGSRRAATPASARCATFLPRRGSRR